MIVKSCGTFSKNPDTIDAKKRLCLLFSLLLLSLCTPFMTVWVANWRSANNKWKEEITVFSVCSYFCFLVCCCYFFFRTRKSLLEWPSARRFQTIYANKRSSPFIFFFLRTLQMSSRMDKWPFYSIDAKRRLSSCFCFYFLRTPQTYV